MNLKVLILSLVGAVVLMALFMIQDAVAQTCTDDTDCSGDGNECTADRCTNNDYCDAISPCLGTAECINSRCTGVCVHDAYSCDGTIGGDFCRSKDGACSIVQSKSGRHPICQAAVCVIPECDSQTCPSPNFCLQSSGACACEPSPNIVCGTGNAAACIRPDCLNDLECPAPGLNGSVSCKDAGTCSAQCTYTCSLAGQACDDGNPNTSNDTWRSQNLQLSPCICEGTGPTPTPPPGLSCTISASPNPVGANTPTSITLIESDLTGHNNHKIIYGDGSDSGLFTTHNSTLSHTYTANGAYTVTGQLITRSCFLFCFDSVEASCTAGVGVSPSLFVALSANPSAGDVPFSTTLSADVSGTATGTLNYTFWWDCNSTSTSVADTKVQCGDPDGTSGNLSGVKFDGITDDPKSVPHTYLSSATYTAKVIVERGIAPPAESRVTIPVTSPGGSSDWSISSSWKTPKHAYPQVEFGCSQGISFSCSDIFKTNKAIQFTDQTIFSDASTPVGLRGWLWTFGDGGTSTQTNPTHAFLSPDIYNVTDKVSDKDGYVCSLTKPINVQRPIPIWKEVLPRLGI